MESVRTLGDGAEDKVGDDLTSYEGGTKEVSEIGPMLVKLAGLLKENDLEAEEYMESIKKYLSGTGPDEDMRRLENQINKLDFKNAQKTLTRIARNLGVFIEGDQI